MKASLPGNDLGLHPVVVLPLRRVPAEVSVLDWLSPDWEDNGWNKAMRDIAKRLHANGVPCVVLEPEA